jgi:sarcosine oxidase subunit alpha
MHKVRAGAVLLATGAQERPLVFANNDVPGCMQANAVSAYIRQYGVRPGKQLVLMTTNNSAYQAAFDWVDTEGGAAVVVDTRAAPDPVLVARAKAAGIRVMVSSAVIETKGLRQVKSAIVSGFNSQTQTLMGSLVHIKADVIASSGGWSPVVHLSCHTGTRPEWREDISAFVPGVSKQNMWTAGAVIGDFSLASALGQGIDAATSALTQYDLPRLAVPEVQEAIPLEMEPCFHIPHTRATSRAPMQFVDYQLDVTAASIELATREGFESVEHVKRYTALGFGTDQGKISNVNGVAIAAKALGRSIAETGTTMFRPNYTPVSFGAMAGRDVGKLFEPKRYTAMQSWHEQNGALFEDVGQWKRPWYFPQGCETMRAAVDRECLAVRNGVGILDASTLGKIDIQGADAREFLNRIYTNAWLKLGVGKCRYGLMCGEDGMVMDDGVTACLADNHFVMTTTTGGAARVLEWLELWHQTEWPELNVYFNTVTDHWATATISGPDARALLSELTDTDLDSDNFPFMAWREGMVADIPGRIFRISFTGELSYEINVNANYGLTLWERLIEAGKKYNLTPYGTETMHVLRAEKGFIIVGQDTDGAVTPEDLGMEWAIARRKKFSFVGKRGMAREDCQRAQRKQLVGLSPVDANIVLPEGSQIVFERPTQLPADMVGHVTSSYFSPTLDKSFALALVRGGLDRLGETVQVSIGPDEWMAAEICSTVFYDPAGARQNV